MCAAGTWGDDRIRAAAGPAAWAGRAGGSGSTVVGHPQATRSRRPRRSGPAAPPHRKLHVCRLTECNPNFIAQPSSAHVQAIESWEHSRHYDWTASRFRCRAAETSARPCGLHVSHGDTRWPGRGKGACPGALRGRGRLRVTGARRREDGLEEKPRGQPGRHRVVPPGEHRHDDAILRQEIDPLLAVPEGGGRRDGSPARRQACCHQWHPYPPSRRRSPDSARPGDSALTPPSTRRERPGVVPSGRREDRPSRTGRRPAGAGVGQTPRRGSPLRSPTHSTSSMPSGAKRTARVVAERLPVARSRRPRLRQATVVVQVAPGSPTIGGSEGTGSRHRWPSWRSVAARIGRVAADPPVSCPSGAGPFRRRGASRWSSRRRRSGAVIARGDESDMERGTTIPAGEHPRPLSRCGV